MRNNKRKISDYSRWVLSGVLIIAGILKIFDPENLVEVLLFFGLFSEYYAYLFTYTVSVFEIALGVTLFFKIKFRVIQKIVFVLFIIFLAISIVGYLDNWQFACGCLGRFSFGKFDLGMVLRNLLLVSMSGWIILEKYSGRELQTG